MNQRVAVVTGGVGGLGASICRALADAGRTVVATDLAHRGDAIEAFLDDRNGRDMHFEPMDVSRFEDCADTLSRIAESRGPIDILVNAAGITRDASLRKMSVEQWRSVLSVDLESVFNTCRQVIEPMMQRGFGRIVNISSVNAQTGQFGQTNYAAAKAGMHGFTMSLAREAARKGVTVNSVSPGYVDTEMTRAIRHDIRAQIIESIPVGRIGMPDDIARVVRFLCEDDADYITGANVPVNGGMFMSF
ncbi:MAG: acetoacetyl-CoA reductase [Xanthomonadales bacterium]|nr:acetoacetyl-CoA reductase [Xanthomonadales bacterium]